MRPSLLHRRLGWCCKRHITSWAASRRHCSSCLLLLFLFLLLLLLVEAPHTLGDAMGRTGQKVQKGSLGAALLRTQKKTSATATTDIQSSAGKHVSARDGGDATVALASYLEGSSLVRLLRVLVLLLHASAGLTVPASPPLATDRTTSWPAPCWPTASSQPSRSACCSWRSPTMAPCLSSASPPPLLLLTNRFRMADACLTST